MKCEKCNEKEATFYYSCNINGEKTERHLCADCAREEGFGGAMDWHAESLFGDVLADFFAPHRSLLSPFDMFDRPLRRMIAPVLPRIQVEADRPETKQRVSEPEQRIPADAGAEVKARREIAALKHRLHEAVKAEDFETAIQLRDQLKALEQKN